MVLAFDRQKLQSDLRKLLEENNVADAERLLNLIGIHFKVSEYGYGEIKVVYRNGRIADVVPSMTYKETYLNDEHKW